MEIDGDGELQQAVRFALFHALQAGARAERRAIPAKGLTGPGYDGHAFWDTEMFRAPGAHLHAAHGGRRRAALAPRTLDLALGAREDAGARGRRVPVADDPRAGVLGVLAGRNRGVPHQRRHRGRGHPVPAVDRRRGVRGHHGLELLVQTARLWRSLGHHDHAGASTSTASPARTSTPRWPTTTSHEPDGRAEPARRPRSRPPRGSAAALGVDVEEIAAWRDAATAMHMPFDERLQVHPQSEGFTAHACSTSTSAQYPLLLHVPYFQLYRTQVVKQADLVLALLHARQPLHPRGEGARLRLLRADHRARFVAVGVHAGGRGGRGRASGARLRLLRRGRPDGPRQPDGQHARRAAHRVAGRIVDRGGGRIRRDARPRRRARLPPRLPAVDPARVPGTFRGSCVRVEVRGQGPTRS